MHFVISPEERRLTLSSSGGESGSVWEAMKAVKGASSCRWYSYRSVLPTLLIAAILLPFIFIRAAFLALDAGASICPSISCLGWTFGPRFLAGDSSSEFMKELRRAYVDGSDGVGSMDPKAVETAPESLDDLIAEMAASAAYQHLDIKTFVLKTKAMLMKMDQKVQSARFRASMYRHLASVGIPKSMHCISLRLAEEYLVNALARSSLPPPQNAFRLTNASYVHIALITDNVLAAAVAVSSTISSSADPENIVFHIVTDKKTYTAMHAWFALHPVSPAIVEVRGLHQFDWPAHVNAVVMETVDEIHQSSLAYRYYKGADENYRRLEALKPSTFSLLNYLRIHLPELFPKLRRVILLDDDVVVRKDFTPLWNVDLNGNVIGAVISHDDDKVDEGHCLGNKIGNYLNFSNPLISSFIGLRRDQCAWLGGMNIFDLQAWRNTNITETYQHWLKFNRQSGFVLWAMGSLPPALIAFAGQVHPIEPSWNLSGLGRRMAELEKIESAAVLHFSGPGKPWLEIGYPDLREMWRAHLNHSDGFLRSCKVME